MIDLTRVRPRWLRRLNLVWAVPLYLPLAALYAAWVGLKEFGWQAINLKSLIVEVWGSAR